MKLAVIPARGGSKRIPRKNIKRFHGRPMIGWSIAAALDSGCFDRVIVSTDDEEIGHVAREHGAEVPFLRPAELSGDHVATGPVIAHAIDCMRQIGCPAAEVCCIYATAPFISVDDLRRGRDVLAAGNCDYAFAVTSYPFPVQRAIRITEAGRVEMFHPEHFNVRSQDLEAAFHDAGQFYWGRAEAWLAGRPVFGTHSAPIIVPRYRVQDIDTDEDWTRAELIFTSARRASA